MFSISCCPLHYVKMKLPVCVPLFTLGANRCEILFLTNVKSPFCNSGEKMKLLTMCFFLSSFHDYLFRRKSLRYKKEETDSNYSLVFVLFYWQNYDCDLVS